MQKIDLFNDYESHCPDLLNDWRKIKCLISEHLRKTNFPETQSRQNRFVGILIVLVQYAQNQDHIYNIKRAATSYNIAIK